MQSVGNRVGVQEPFLMRMAHGASSQVMQRSRYSGKSLQGKHDHKLGILTHGMLSDEQMLRVCKRFYVALILSRLVQVNLFHAIGLSTMFQLYLLFIMPRVYNLILSFTLSNCSAGWYSK